MRIGASDGSRSVELGEPRKVHRLGLEQERDSTMSRPVSPTGGSDVRTISGYSPHATRTIPAPTSPSSSVQAPFRPLFRLKFRPLPHRLTGKAHPLNCGRYDHLPYSQLRELRNSRGYSRKGSKAVIITRLASTDEVDRNRTVSEDDAMDTSETSGCGGYFGSTPRKPETAMPRGRSPLVPCCGQGSRGGA